MLVVGRDTLSALDPRRGETVWDLKVAVTAELFVGDDGLIGMVVTPPDQPFGTKLLMVDSDDGRVVWTVDARVRITPRIATGDDLVAALVGDPAKLVAYDRATGVERWHADFGDALPPSLTFAGGRFVGATEGGAVRAFTEDGRDAWIDSSSRNTVNPPVTDGGALFVSASTPLDRRTDDLESFFLRC